MAGKLGRGAFELSLVGLAGAAASAVYVIHAPLWAIPLTAIGTWSTLRLMFARPARARHGADDAAELQALDASYREQISEVIRASANILSLSERATDPVVRSRGRDIAAALNRVIAHLQEDPDDLRASQKFLAVYIERTKYILARYVQYESLATPQAEAVRAKVRDELLPLLVELCEAQLQRITYDDLRSLETDVDVLKKAMSLEGL